MQSFVDVESTFSGQPRDLGAVLARTPSPMATVASRDC
jgi:hypothetical protein